LSNRSSFLQGKPPYLLLFWELADKHQILATTMQRFDPMVAAEDASMAPSVISRTPSSLSIRRGGTTNDSDEKLLDALKSIAASQSSAAEAQREQNRAEDRRSRERSCHQSILQCEQRKHEWKQKLLEYQIKRFEASGESVANFWDKQCKSIETEIENEQQKISSLELEKLDSDRETQETQETLFQTPA